MMRYALENKNEAERLEEQSQARLYDYRGELRDFIAGLKGPVLDAGCGSGVVTRYLASCLLDQRIVGCDRSLERLKSARELAAGVKNIEFTPAILLELPYDSGMLGGVVCRFVIEHLGPKEQPQAIAEIFRCLKPGGRVCLVDLDGMYHNLYPMPASVAEMLKKLEIHRAVDLQVGRRLPHLLSLAGFESISWRIETMEFRGEDLEVEVKLMRDRLENAREFIIQLLGSEKAARQCETDFLEGMRRPSAVLFYNKFIVIAKKPGLALARRP